MFLNIIISNDVINSVVQDVSQLVFCNDVTAECKESSVAVTSLKFLKMSSFKQ